MKIAIDPGVDGAIAIRTNSTTKVIPMDLANLAKLLKTVGSRHAPGPSTVVVEKLTGTGGNNPFPMVENYGEILGLCRANEIIPRLIPPQVWQLPYNVSGMPYADRKAALWRIAVELRPKTLKPHADALLLLEWADTKSAAQLARYSRF